ncbi:MAG TPA: hypothetical protein VKV24_01675 [Casimicrobiaceae bacterium]|nr:hypothetical protein [Casimicrobiaceae bacterium]
MNVHRWYAISGDHPDLGLSPTSRGMRYLIDNDPARDPTLNPARTMREWLRRRSGREPKAAWSGVVGFSAITEAWNGAVYASRSGASGSMIVFGGGHNDYFGSDVHAFDLATRQWRRISDGYIDGDDSEYGEGARYPNAEYPDGSPLPPHTYGYVQYDPIGNDYILFKGQTELGPNVKAVAIPHLFNLDTFTWRRGPRHDKAILSSGGFTTWDASRRVIWGHAGDDGGGNAFISFCPDFDERAGTFGHWGEMFPSKLPGVANGNAMQWHPKRDIIVVAVHAHDALFAIDPAHPGRDIVPLESVGHKPPLQPFAAMECAPSIDRIVYFSPMDGGVVHLIAAPNEDGPRALTCPWTWQVCALAAKSMNPIADAARRSRFAVNRAHAFGRFRIASFDGTDVAILVRHVDGPVYAMRLN